MISTSVTGSMERSKTCVHSGLPKHPTLSNCHASYTDLGTPRARAGRRPARAELRTPPRPRASYLPRHAEVCAVPQRQQLGNVPALELAKGACPVIAQQGRNIVGINGPGGTRSV